MQPLHARSSIHLAAAWCGIAYILMLLLGWGLVAGFVPPLHPDAGPQEVAALYQADATRIRIGMVVVLFGALVFIPFAAILTRFIARIEGGMGVLTYTALLGSAGNMILTFYPAMTWLIAVYRPERDPEILSLMSDAGWLQFVGGATVLLGMPLAIGVAALMDRSPDPVFPRWAGYLQFWLILLIIPDQLLFFFRSGPLSWNGLFGLWIPVTSFAVWFVSTFYFLRRAVLKERVAPAPVHDALV
jgi:MFS family permease